PHFHPTDAQTGQCTLMTQSFPLDTTIDDGRLILVEWLAGSPEQGVYLAADVPQEPTGMPAPLNYLVSTALEPDDFETWQMRVVETLALLVPGIAPLYGVAHIEASSGAGMGVPANAPTDVPTPALIGLVEACPAGVRSNE